MSKAVIAQLVDLIITNEHEQRDRYEESHYQHNEQKERMYDYINDLRRYIEKLEAEIIEKNGVLETTGKPHHVKLDDCKPQRIVAYK